MAYKALIFLFVAGAVFIGNEAASTYDDYGEIYEEKDVVLQDGTVVHDQRKIDSDCLHETNLATFPDQSKSTVLTDYEDGKSLMLFSGSAGVCYVRDVTDEEQKAIETCEDGIAERGRNAPAEQETEYVEAGEITLEDLPAALRQQCQGHKVVKMVEKPAEELERELKPSDDMNPETGFGLWPRMKRSCRWVVICSKKFQCKLKCGWKGCSLKCSWTTVCKQQRKC